MASGDFPEKRGLAHIFNLHSLKIGYTLGGIKVVPYR
jgi:hypothetical protein